MSEITITLAPALEDDIMAIGRELLPAGFRLEVLSKTELSARLPEIKYLLSMNPGWLDDAQLAGATQLQIIQLMSVGYDSLNIEGARKAGIPIAVNGGANAISVAEHTIMFILALLRRLTTLDANVRTGRWRDGATGTLRIHEIWSQTVGIVGMGRIGQHVVERLRPFAPGAILYFDPIRLSPEREQQLGMRYVSMDELLCVSDIVTLHVPLSNATHHLIGRESLALMKKSAILVNTSRGGLVDELALAAALRDGQIAGAGLDVFSQEPPPVDHPLFTVDNALLTPHLAGPTWESFPRRFVNCFENIARVARGEKALWVIPELVGVLR